MKTKIKSFFNNLGLRFRETMGNDKVGYFLSSLFSAFFFASLVTLFFVLKVDDYPNLNFTGLDYLKYVPRKLFISLFISLFLALIIVSLIIKTSKVIYISLAIIT